MGLSFDDERNQDVDSLYMLLESLMVHPIESVLAVNAHMSELPVIIVISFVAGQKCVLMCNIHDLNINSKKAFFFPEGFTVSI